MEIQKNALASESVSVNCGSAFVFGLLTRKSESRTCSSLMMLHISIRTDLMCTCYQRNYHYKLGRICTNMLIVIENSTEGLIETLFETHQYVEIN